MGRQTNSGALTESVFYILLRLHNSAHGYALMKDIAEMTNNRVNLGAGTLYGALDTLQKKGWIRQLDSNPQDRKIEYIITDTGKKYFELELIRLEELLKNSKTVKEKINENNS
ncbi:PadR family transcriptional regulator [Parvimonas micra]|uniref:PadR family transcriptional regulator n=1 Tax=Parvimonas micra TaxID=33033 RepID=UPI0020057C0D|nr:PadR family transcriptional regulator [Parvimonas micra]MCK6130423.1 PadR family transcriptional regulator [Parvimonas micra]MCK6136070.1 PadR family transcriptional regulator [Parvimonas micra]MCK6137541.1 PadR family transcriptional regulator [Parvimonas micra]MCK6154069.1 PadR family transcriptional regulator [Parvimonas micra]MCZ7409617.1 PadR family transcriptional regulator [Parvimonas micra]